MNRVSASADLTDPVRALAAQLRELRERSHLSYRMLSLRTHYAKSTLASAVGGRSLPSWSVVAAFVRACGDSESDWRPLWDEAHRLIQAQRAVPALPAAVPAPPSEADLASVATPSDLTDAINRLWKASGRPSLRQIATGSGDALGRTTIHEVLAGDRSKPEWSTIRELVTVLRQPGESPDEDAWRAAWQRARERAETESRYPLSRTPVRSCNPIALGVHPGLSGAADQPAFIERDISGDVQAAVAAARENGGFILLIGEEGSGKTRLAYESLQAEVPDFRLFTPASAEDFSGTLPPRTVVWLDNIDQYLSWTALTPLAIQAMLNSTGPVIVMGTMCAKRYEDSVGLPDPSSREDQQRQREILIQARVFPLPVQLSDAELVRAQKRWTDQHVSAGLEAEDSEPFRTLASGPHLTHRWATADPYARAVITAAADSRRVGVTGPMQRHLLRDAADCYLSPLDREQAAHDWFDDALAYAMAPVPGGLAPLMPENPGTTQPGGPAYRIPRYLFWLRESETHQELAAASELTKELTALNCTGPAYLTVEDDLKRYATSVLSQELQPAPMPYTGRHRSPESHPALTLARETVDEVLPYFRHELTIRYESANSWQHDSGDSPAAWFIAMCREALPDRGGQSPAAASETEDQWKPKTDQLPSSAGSAILRIILGTHLRQVREAAFITRERAAADIGMPESRLGHIELGRSSVRVTDVLRLLTFYDTTAHEREGLLALAEQADRPGWWHRYHDIVPEWFRAYAGMEKVAQSVQLYEQQYIPGLLQTEEYASAVISLCDYPPGDARRHVKFRSERQRRFRDRELTLWAIVDEAALRRTIAGTDVQIRQLGHLMEQLDTQPNLTLQIVPCDARAYPVPAGFSILRFAEIYLSDVVYVENLTSALYIDEQAESAHYLHAFDRLTKVASDRQQTVQFLEQVIRDVDSPRKEPG